MAGRARQCRLEEVLRQSQRGQPGDRRRPDAARPVAAGERQHRRHPAEAGRADDRHEQRRLRQSPRKSPPGSRRSSRSCGQAAADEGPGAGDLPPRARHQGPLRQVNAKANEIIAKLADGKNVFFLDIGESSSKDGTLPTDNHARPAAPQRQGLCDLGRSHQPSVKKLIGIDRLPNCPAASSCWVMRSETDKREGTLAQSASEGKRRDSLACTSG